MGCTGGRVNIALLTVKREALRKELQRLDAITPSCSNCNHYLLEMCKVYDQAPPSEWFRGPIDCESWEFDALPF